MARRSHLGSIWRAQRFQAAQEQFDAPAAVIKAPEIDEHASRCQDGRYQNLDAANSTNRARCFRSPQRTGKIMSASFLAACAHLTVRTLWRRKRVSSWKAYRRGPAGGSSHFLLPTRGKNHSCFCHNGADWCFPSSSHPASRRCRCHAASCHACHSNN